MKRRDFLKICIFSSALPFLNLFADERFDLDTAFELAKRKNKPVYLLVASSGCSHCANHIKNTITPNFNLIQKYFEFALIDLGKGDRLPQNLPVINKTPTTLILSPYGELMADPIEGDFSGEYLHKLIDVLRKHYGA